MKEIHNDGTTIIHDDRKHIDIHEAVEIIMNGGAVIKCEPFYVDDDGFPCCDDGESVSISTFCDCKPSRTYIYNYLRGYDLFIE